MSILTTKQPKKSTLLFLKISPQAARSGLPLAPLLVFHLIQDKIGNTNLFPWWIWALCGWTWSLKDFRITKSITIDEANALMWFRVKTKEMTLLIAALWWKCFFIWLNLLWFQLYQITFMTNMMAEDFTLGEPWYVEDVLEIHHCGSVYLQRD
jgi:hypothetical protein